MSHTRTKFQIETIDTYDTHLSKINDLTDIKCEQDSSNNIAVIMLTTSKTVKLANIRIGNR